MNKPEENKGRTGLEIAVIGMAGRFPRAGNIAEFWENLENGIEGISFFSDEELVERGIAPEVLKDPNYVKANGVLEDWEYFDASFFGYTPKEAEIMNPQLRLFHECVWTALEDTGYDPKSYQGAIGLYAGAFSSFDWQALGLLSGKLFAMGAMVAGNLVEKDFLCTRLSYNLNLKGPSFVVHSACSTSLVAIHMACRALLTGECKMAAAGGVTAQNVQEEGYIYQEGMIYSPDGHCRAFDARANGTVGGNGVGVVVLKSLGSALADGDHIYAVVKGSAANNDGSRKIGFTAPSIEGQAEVIKTAQRMSRVTPETVGYIEAHGTGTNLGDPVEIEALKLVFKTDKRNFCGIGSVKSNIGHTDCAAGVAGFIKTVLALKHRLIPPTLYFETPNPKIDFENSPFYVVTRATEWKRDGGPLRAGVSSFGIGGTNVHVVLEEAPEREPSSPGREWQILLLSARTPSALDKAALDMAAYLEGNPGVNLADAAYTLQVGRRAFSCRRMVVSKDPASAREALAAGDPEKVQTYLSAPEDADKPVVFMFPGQGAQYVDMGLELYRTEVFFREEMDRCFDILQDLGYDIKAILYPGETQNRQAKPVPADGKSSGTEPINQTEVAQLVIFVFQYALATLLKKWGIEPRAMIGHSIGEYVAACLSGVFSPRDALGLVARRGKLMQQLPPGSMLSVPLSEKELKPLLSDRVSLAAVNGVSHCVVSGPHEAIEDFAAALEEKGHRSRLLHTSHAFHSPMMEPILEEFEEKVGEIRLNKPVIPYVSNISGKWIAVEEATDPGYWARHIRATVRFGDGAAELLKEEDVIFVEIGPGQVLSTFLRQHPQRKEGHEVMNLTRHPREEISDVFYLLKRMGELWLYGKRLDWSSFHAPGKRYRLPLPTYPFEGQRFLIEGDIFKMGAEVFARKPLLVKKKDPADWFYVPSWKRSPLPLQRNENDQEPQPQPHRSQRWLVFMDEFGLGKNLVKRLEEEGREVVSVRCGSTFAGEEQNLYTLDPGNSDDYRALIDELYDRGTGLDRIVHLWSLVGDCREGESGPEDLEESQDKGLYSLVYLAQALGNRAVTEPLDIFVVSDHLQEVTGEELLCPEKSTLLGPVKIIPREYANIRCRSIDIVLPKSGETREEEQRLLDQLGMEFDSDGPGQAVAYRGSHRWVQTFEPLGLEKSGSVPSLLRKGGVYLVTGGLGGMGLVLAGYLAETVKARLMLVGRTPLPPREEWETWLKGRRGEDNASDKIRRLREMEELGAEVAVFSADVSDREEMQRVISQIKDRCGGIDGVFHAAGIADFDGVIQRRSKETTENVLAPKVKGTLVLDELLGDEDLDFFVLCSSLSSIVPPFGQVGYVAANAFLDTYAHHKNPGNGRLTVSINWDAWQETGMALEAEKKMAEARGESLSPSGLEEGISNAEGIEVLSRVLRDRQPQVAVSTKDLKIIMEMMDTPGAEESLMESPPGTGTPNLYDRPKLSVQYAAPRNGLEQTLARMWRDYFGFKEIGIYDDFFELGGDSLLGMTFINQCKKLLGETVQFTIIFNASNIAKLSAYFSEHYPEAAARLGGMAPSPEIDFTESAPPPGEMYAYAPIEAAEKKEYYELTSAQKRIYFLQQMYRDDPAYNITQVQVIEGDIPGEKLADLFRALIRRHESLRTSFLMLEGEPRQKVHPQVPFDIEYCDAGGSEEGTEEWVDDLLRAFDLGEAPLFRIGMVKIEEAKHLLTVCLHHIVSDAFSMGILVNEFLALYTGTPLPDVAIQYKDYVEWQNSRMEKAAVARQEAFWLEELAGPVPVLRLPTDYPRPEVQSLEGKTIEFELGHHHTRLLKKLALAHEATPNMLLFALYNVLVAKLSGQQDIIIGTLVAGRRHPDLEKVIGMFVNTLALRNYPREDRLFTHFLKEVKERMVKALENQEYQFEDLVDKLTLKRDSGRNPLFDVLFTFQKVAPDMGMESEPGETGPEIEQKVGDLSLKDYEYGNTTSKFDLILDCIDAGENILCAFDFCTKLFRSDTIERFIDYFKNIVGSVLDHPEKRIGEIELIGKEEEMRLLRELKDEKSITFTGKTGDSREPTPQPEADFDF